MNVVVTGAGGFVGGYLIELLLLRGHVVTAIGIGQSSTLKYSSISTHEIDILDNNKLEKCFAESKPDVVIHLAAISNVPISWTEPQHTIEVNVQGTINVLEALQNSNPNGIFLNVGSSDMYGLSAKSEMPLTEDILCQPQNPYSISKYCAELLCLQLGKKSGIHVIQTRSFNHFGPGQAKGFVVSDFASQIATIERKKQEPIIRVGDLSSYRDFSFVTDIVEAYVSLIEKKAEAGIYNICSGNAVKIETILNKLISFSKIPISIEINRDKLRLSEVPFFIGNCSKLITV